MRLRLIVPLIALGVVAQQPPANTEVFLATLTMGAQTKITGPLTNISNSPGYDSQPSFLPDGSGVLFSSVRGGTQYSIYKYDIASQKVVQVTHTAENENSPIVTPDGKTFSVVQTEGDKAQRLWRFDLDGTHPRLVLENIKPVGYHVWVDATHLVLYVLGTGGSPSTLQFVDTVTGKSEVIGNDPGRSLIWRSSNDTVLSVRQPRGARAIVEEFYPKSPGVGSVVYAVDGSTNRDCALLPNDVLLMSSGTKIYAWKLPAPGIFPRLPAESTAWAEVADFAAAGIVNITRMAVGPAGPDGTPRFALVAEPVAK